MLLKNVSCQDFKINIVNSALDPLAHVICNKHVVQTTKKIQNG